MQTKTPILLATIVLGVLAIGGVGLIMLKPAPTAPAPTASGPGVAQAATAPTPVPQMRFIAARDIPPRVQITSDMLRRTEVAGANVPGAITSLDDLRGKITSVGIASGDVVTEDDLVPKLARAIPARFEVPSGFRAVAIYVDPTQTAAGMVDVGDRVDVIVTQKLEFDKAERQYIVGAKQFSAGRTIATDLLVLAVDKSLATPIPTPTPAADDKGKAAPGGAVAAPNGLPADAAPPPAGGTAPAEVRPNGASPDAAAGGKTRVFLAAPLEIASRLVTANDGGILHVVIRNPQDGDNALAPETREYPSRLITLAKPKENNGGGGGGGGFSGGGEPAMPMPLPALPDVTVTNSSPAPPPVPMPIQAAAPESGGGSGEMASAAPSGPPMADVMVVRATEKSRVLVPQR